MRLFNLISSKLDSWILEKCLLSGPGSFLFCLPFSFGILRRARVFLLWRDRLFYLTNSYLIPFLATYTCRQIANYSGRLFVHLLVAIATFDLFHKNLVIAPPRPPALGTRLLVNKLFYSYLRLNTSRLSG